MARCTSSDHDINTCKVSKISIKTVRGVASTSYPSHCVFGRSESWTNGRSNIQAFIGISMLKIPNSILKVPTSSIWKKGNNVKKIPNTWPIRVPGQTDGQTSFNSPTKIWGHQTRRIEN